MGVFYDYSSDQGVVLMAYGYRALYDDPAISSVAPSSRRAATWTGW